jgi:hypothetical protein
VRLQVTLAEPDGLWSQPEGKATHGFYSSVEWKNANKAAKWLTKNVPGDGMCGWVAIMLIIGWLTLNDMVLLRNHCGFSNPSSRGSNPSSVAPSLLPGSRTLLPNPSSLILNNECWGLLGIMPVFAVWCPLVYVNCFANTHGQSGGYEGRQ